MIGKPLLVFLPGTKYYKGSDDADIRLLDEELWDKKDTSFITPLFRDYCEWFNRRIKPQFEGQATSLNLSHFPGDLCVEIIRPGKVRLLVVGLNSSWLQYSSGNFEGRLEISTRQFQAALSTSDSAPPLDVFKRHPHALLLMHHPPAWLGKRAQQAFLETVHPSGRFTACLHGHMHEGRSIQIGIGGGRPRHYFQSHSLFGLEHYGSSRESRIMGYAWGRMTAQGEIRIWPLKRVNRGGGEAVFDFDQSFSGDLSEGVVLRPAAPYSGEPRPETSISQKRLDDDDRIDSDLDQYLKWALDRYAGVDLIGVGGGDLRLDLDDVYVPLRIAQRSPIADLDMRKKRQRIAAEEQALEEIELEDVFRVAKERQRQVAIFGDPGAGKTTALRKLLQLCITGEPEALRLAPGTVPLFLRLRKLTPEALDSPISDFIERELAEMSAHQLASGLGARLWRRGRLLLLLDGLDEIADNTLRARACHFLERSLTGTGRRKIRAAVSSRYAGYGEDVKLGGRFLHLDIRPLDAEQVRQFVRRWFAEACKAIGTEAEAKHKAGRLIEALDGRAYGSQRLKVLVGTPLLLTLLCLIVLRGREMPRRRTEFYRQCLEVLLSRWGKTEKAREPLVDLDTALALLRPLAHELHANNRRDDLSRAEFVDFAEQRLSTLEQAVDGFELLRWLHEQTGVIEEYAPSYYGFMHLGLQEYLTALHIAQ